MSRQIPIHTGLSNAASKVCLKVNPITAVGMVAAIASTAMRHPNRRADHERLDSRISLLAKRLAGVTNTMTTAIRVPR